ncbi:MAG TPA: hypothetical protein VHT30_00125 [Acidimicrobiales bacterium]|jgi:hypothetical protein|nr:hypothetical protein [Acidimicrobiales bacterium]
MTDLLPTNADYDGRIVFYEYFPPPLESGDYTVTVSQRVKSTDKDKSFDDTFTTSLSFAALGPRFSLPPGYLNAVFPPDTAQGEYSAVAPHAVFPIATLPWQRAAKEATTRYPWLALLTFDQDDPPPPIHTGTIDDLQKPADGIVSYPGLAKLDYGESASDPVLFVDCPATLFSAIAPGLDELPWLAHGRTIEAGRAERKPDVNDEPPGVEYSVVVSNRLPAPGHKSVCYLVSLENMGDLLPPKVLTMAFVRLAVVATWSFASQPLGETFREYFQNLDRTPATLQIPEGNIPNANPVSVAALQMGYTAFNHHTRHGADTVSWYRGPLLPYENPVDIDPPLSSADSLVRYDPGLGMFDVSLACAWQLGQLLALADKEFATGLYNWKHGQKQQAVRDFERAFLHQLLSLEPPTQASALGIVVGSADTSLLDQVMGDLVQPLLSAFLQTGRPT